MAEADNIFELFFENSIDLLCVIDKNGYFKKINPEWNHTLGYTTDEIEGKQLEDFLHPGDSTKTSDESKNQKNRVNDLVNRFRHKDGSYHWIKWRTFQVDDLIYASARDISARVEAEKALKENEEKSRIRN